MTIVELENARSRARDSLARRLRVVAPHIVDDESLIDSAAARGPGALLDLLARRVRQRDEVELVWLLLAAVLAMLPGDELVIWTRRRLRAEPEIEALGVIMHAGLREPVGLGDRDAEIEVVSGDVVDVNFCARYVHNTGIQRVVRETVSRWCARHPDLTLVAWDEAGVAMRRLSAVETTRVVSWNDRGDGGDSTIPRTLVIPFRGRVILPEVPQAFQSPPLASLAAHSGNQVVMVGYDMIPVVSPNTVPEGEIEKFSQYLGIVKHASVVAAISDTARREFAGFASALAAQGLVGPRVMAVPLPIDIPAAHDRGEGQRTRPLVLCVGSQEPRKNHEAVLFAAESLWSEGHDFELEFIGGGSAENIRRFDQHVRRLQRRGHPVQVRRGVGDAELLTAYSTARFTVFPSIHEGYGLPVAESIARGTPVVTTAYGPTGEIGAQGGCLLVNPRDDEALVRAMRELLVDDAVLDRLRDEIRARPVRTWDDYAAELWSSMEAAHG